MPEFTAQERLELWRHAHGFDKQAMPTYYHRSVNPVGDRPDHAYPHTYVYSADDPHDVSHETRAYGDQVYSTDLSEDQLEADPAQPRSGTEGYQSNQDNGNRFQAAHGYSL